MRMKMLNIGGLQGLRFSIYANCCTVLPVADWPRVAASASLNLVTAGSDGQSYLRLYIYVLATFFPPRPASNKARRTMLKSKRAPVISLTIFFLILLSTGLSGYYIWQGVLHGFDKYLPILASTLLLDGLGVFALVFKVTFENRRRALTPFICSILLILVCSVHLAALANMRVWATAQDEQTARAQSLDDDRHARNVTDANELVDRDCSNCSPERKRRMYQSEMARLEKAPQAPANQSTQSIGSGRSWGRRYV